MNSSTLLLRLAGPMQSWGTDSKFDTRRTEKEPSKSGVVGLLASALGRKREDSIQDLANLRFGVRVDEPGIILRDFHMVHRDNKTSYLTNRYYIEDAVFLIGMESEDTRFLEEIKWAVQNPRYPLFLGRRCCPPTLPIMVGIRKKSLEEALRSEPMMCGDNHDYDEREIFIYCEPNEDEFCHAYRRDCPISFDKKDRKYGYRGIKAENKYFRNDQSILHNTNHDFFSEAEE